MKLFPPPPAHLTQEAARIDEAIGGMTIVAVALFGVAMAILVASLLLHRDRPGNKRFSITSPKWPALTIAVVAFLLVEDFLLVRRSRADLAALLPPEPEGAVRVQVFAQQWAWHFRYAGPDGRFGTADDALSLNELRLPAGRAARLQLASKDVIHAFYVPAARLKIDANPGRIAHLHVAPTREGLFEIACSQHCGWAHTNMRGELRVLAPAEFDRWVGEASLQSSLAYDPADDAAHWGWSWE